MSSNWVVAKVRSYSQFLIKRNYELFFSDIVKVDEFFFPYCQLGKKYVLLLEDYLFIKVFKESLGNLDVWRKFERNFKYFFTNSENTYFFISDVEMENFKRKSAEYMRTKYLKEPENLVGKIAYIKSGVLSGLIGHVREVFKNGKVKIYVSVFRCVLCIDKEHIEIIE